MILVSLTVFPETLEASDPADYLDDFEEDEDKDEYYDEIVDTSALQPDDYLDEFQLCDAGGLTITLKLLKETG